MYKYFIAVCTILVICGCASTKSTVIEFDQSGRVLKKTETSESVISTVMSSTRNKSVIIWEDGWAAYISGSTGTADDPTPHGKIFCGKVNKGCVSILKNQQNIVDIATVIRATKSNIAISFDGIKNTNSQPAVNSQ